MATDVVMPQMGESIAEGTIVRWIKKVGDKVDRDEPLFDLDTALRREHEERLLRASVERDREVVLLRDVGGLLDPELADDMAVDVEAEDPARLLLGVGRIVGELHAAGLAAAAGQDLGLDDDRAADRRRRSAGLFGRDREPSLGDRNADASEELFALILVEIHGGGL